MAAEEVEVVAAAEPVFVARDEGRVPKCPMFGRPGICQTTMCRTHGVYCFICGCCDRESRLGVAPS